MTNTVTVPATTQYLSFLQPPGTAKWFGDPQAVSFKWKAFAEKLEDLGSRCFIVRNEHGVVGVAGSMGTDKPAEMVQMELIATLPAYQPEQLGDPAFRQAYGLKYNYMAGAMANGIASAELVIALGKAGMLGSFAPVDKYFHASNRPSIPSRQHCPTDLTR